MVTGSFRSLCTKIWCQFGASCLCLTRSPEVKFCVSAWSSWQKLTIRTDETTSRIGHRHLSKASKDCTRIADCEVVYRCLICKKVHAFYTRLQSWIEHTSIVSDSTGVDGRCYSNTRWSILLSSVNVSSSWWANWLDNKRWWVNRCQWHPMRWS